MNIGKIALLSASVIPFLNVGAVSAQEAGQPEAQGEDSALSTIVVTATRSETNIQETPIAVTGVSAESIAERNVTNLADIATFVPGLSIGASQGLGSATASIAIRGIGVDSSDSDASVGTYVDEVFFSSGRGNILGLMDTERVEVLRGPQGTLFGRNTIAGAIQYVTRAPSSDFNGYITGTYGSYDRTDIEGAINLPVGDTFAVRVAGRYADRDGFVADEFQGIDRGGETTKAARVRARWTPTDRLTVDLKGEYADFSTNGRAVQVLSVNPAAFFTAGGGLSAALTPDFISTDAGPGDYTFRGFDGPDFFKFEQTILQANIEYDIGDNATLKSITSMSWFEHQLAVDLDQTTLPILNIFDPNYKVEAFTQELQLSGDLADGALRYTTGLYYYNRENRQVPSRILTAAAFGGFPVSPDGDPFTKNEAIAAYAQLSYDITDAITANVGLRYSDETVSGQLLAIPGSVENEASFNDLSPSIGLDFRLSYDAFLYVKASKGFRAGGFTLNAAIPSGAISFLPEEAWTYEAGLRLTALDGRLRFNPTIFQTDWSDIQFLDDQLFGANLIVVTRNAGDARIRGVEIETEFAATDNLSLRGAFAYLDAGYTRVADGFFGVPIVPIDQPLSRAPEFKASVGANYVIPLETNGEISINADYNWVDDQASTARANAVTLPSVGLLNARLQYTDPSSRFTVALFGTNLTNEYVLVGGTRFGTEGTVATDVADLGRPREIGIELRFNF
ncbi:TonB-dependent receptor [Erythrobacter sp. G21629-S1]|jgi:iron complex outermembrane receptor protein|nr:TonB-dependent receptor [Erythrobacter sp. G21629-S1]